MDCEKCSTAKMFATKIYRLSGCLVAIGYTVLIPAILGLIGLTIVAILGVVGGGASAVAVQQVAQQTYIERLNEIEGITTEATQEFETSGTVSDESMSGMLPSRMEMVSQIVTEYEIELAGAAVGGAMVAGMGITMVIVGYIIGIPTFIVGLVLILRKKVWQCRQCGFVFERA